jgi:hypothetical protein
LRAPIIYGDEGKADYILESMGCGVAFLDYDNDGWQDIVVLTGRRRTGPTPAEATIKLYHNNRDGTFRDVTARSGLGRSVWAAGITVGDYDNDGFDDIFITCWGQNILFHNQGDGTFKEVTKEAGLLHEGARYGTGCTWIDYDSARWRLDLFVRALPGLRSGEDSDSRQGSDVCAQRRRPVFQSQRRGPGAASRLYHNNGDGTFSRCQRTGRHSRVKPLCPGHPPLASASDLAGHLRSLRYVASLLFRNNS